MEVQDLQHAERILINATKNGNISEIVVDKIGAIWVEIADSSDDFPNFINEIKLLYLKLCQEITQSDSSNENREALAWLVYETIHDAIMPHFRAQFCKEDAFFFEKCQILCKLHVSAEQFGADENYAIPLSAAIVELSMIDNYKSPGEKINCLCSTYDLLFAEIKAALVYIISQNSEQDTEIPVVNNCDIIPVLMVVIIKAKLIHMCTNLFYIKTFYPNFKEKHLIGDILKAFEAATDRILKFNLETLQPSKANIIQSIDLRKYMEITTSQVENAKTSTTVIEEANQRVLNLITKSTNENLF